MSGNRWHRISVAFLAVSICSLALTATAQSPWARLVFLEAVLDGAGGIVDGLDAVHSITVSPDGRHIYVAANSDDAVVVFSRDPISGMLAFVEVERDGVGGVEGLDGANSVRVSPDGNHVYVAGGDDNAVAVFSRHASTGGLTWDEVEMDGVDGVDGLQGAVSLAVSPDGYYLYVAGFDDNAVAVFERHPGSGALHFVESRSGIPGLGGPASVMVSPDGKNVYAAGATDGTVVVFSRSASTGKLTPLETHWDGVGGVDGLSDPRCVVVSPDGKNLYAVSPWEEVLAVFSRDSTTGSLTFLEAESDGLKGSWWLYDLAVSPDGEHLYVTEAGNDRVLLFARNPIHGDLAFVDVAEDGVDGVDGLGMPVCIVASPDDKHIYVGAQGQDSVVAFLVSRLGLFKTDQPDNSAFALDGVRARLDSSSVERTIAFR